MSDEFLTHAHIAVKHCTPDLAVEIPKDNASLPIAHVPVDSSTTLTQSSNFISGHTNFDARIIEDCSLTMIAYCEVGNCFLSLSAIDKAELMEPRKPLFVM
jgi:hypothetical protein